MTRAQLIAAVRTLQDRADRGWPGGYDPVTVRAEALRLDRLLVQTARTPAEAKALMEQLAEVQLSW